MVDIDTDINQTFFPPIFFPIFFSQFFFSSFFPPPIFPPIFFPSFFFPVFFFFFFFFPAFFFPAFFFFFFFFFFCILSKHSVSAGYQAICYLKTTTTGDCCEQIRHNELKQDLLWLMVMTNLWTQLQIPYCV